MGISPLVFTGVSTFSDDFQTILSRSVAIASLPLQELQADQADLLVRKQLLTDLGSMVAGLATSISDLGALGEARALAAASSNANRVTVTLDGATQSGVYTITDITSIAKAASETSLSGYATADATAVSADGLMELVVGSETYSIDLTGEGENTLEGLRDAINALGAGVSASILNTGTGENPYYLSITALSTGATTLQVRETAGDPDSSLLTADNQGADAVFKLNGLTVGSAENTVTTAIPGVRFTIRSVTDSGEEVTLSLSSDRSGLVNRLSSLASAYNAVREQVNLQIGESAGLLSGDFIVREIQQSLRQLSSYRGDGEIQSLAELGISFDNVGVMSFDSSKVYGLTENDFQAGLDFLGSKNTGLGALSADFKTLSDPVMGLIRTQQNQYDATDERLSEQIEAISTRIEYMQSSLSLKLQQADVLLARMESQQSLLEASLEGLRLAIYGRKDG